MRTCGLWYPCLREHPLLTYNLLCCESSTCVPQSRSSTSSASRSRQRTVHALLAVSFACVALYWASQATVDAAGAHDSGNSATVSDALKALIRWGRRQTMGLMPVPGWGGPHAWLISAFVWASPSGGKQSHDRFSPAQRRSRPRFSRVTVRAFWTEAFADLYNTIRPFTRNVASVTRLLGSLRLRLLLPRFSYGAAAAALLFGCLQHAASRHQQVLPHAASSVKCLSFVMIYGMVWP